MYCPKCGYEKTEVVGTTKGVVNRRFRRCPSCGHTFPTVEAVEFDNYWKEYCKNTVEIEKSFFDKVQK